VRDLEDCLNVIAHDSIAALDCEATSLDTVKAKLVGISISPTPNFAFYIPIGHKLGPNVAWQAVKPRLQEYCLGLKEVLMYNAKYDLDVIETNDGWFIENYFDVLELVYMENPDRQVKKLKVVAKEELGIDMSTFESLFTPEEIAAEHFDISTKSPKRCTDYACADADMTRRIAMLEKFKKVRTDYPFPVKVDTKLVDVIRRIQHDGGFELRADYIGEKYKLTKDRALALEEQIYRVAGTKFEIGSPKQLGLILFERLAYPNEGMTRAKKNPIYKTDGVTMEKLANSYPLVELIIAYRKVLKAQDSYFLKLKKLVDKKIKPRFQFNQYAAPTFRFSAPGGNPEKDGGCGINIQAVSEGEEREMTGVRIEKQVKWKDGDGTLMDLNSTKS